MASLVACNEHPNHLKHKPIKENNSITKNFLITNEKGKIIPVWILKPNFHLAVFLRPFLPFSVFPLSYSPPTQFFPFPPENPSLFSSKIPVSSNISSWITSRDEEKFAHPSFPDPLITWKRPHNSRIWDFPVAYYAFPIKFLAWSVLNPPCLVGCWARVGPVSSSGLCATVS